MITLAATAVFWLRVLVPERTLKDEWQNGLLFSKIIRGLVRVKGLEPPRLAAPEHKSDVIGLESALNRCMGSHVNT